MGGAPQHVWECLTRGCLSDLLPEEEAGTEGFCSAGTICMETGKWAGKHPTFLKGRKSVDAALGSLGVQTAAPSPLWLLHVSAAETEVLKADLGGADAPAVTPAAPRVCRSLLQAGSDLCVPRGSPRVPYQHHRLLCWVRLPGTSRG